MRVLSTTCVADSFVCCVGLVHVMYVMSVAYDRYFGELCSYIPRDQLWKSPVCLRLCMREQRLRAGGAGVTASADSEARIDHFWKRAADACGHAGGRLLLQRHLQRVSEFVLLSFAGRVHSCSRAF